MCDVGFLCCMQLYLHWQHAHTGLPLRSRSRVGPLQLSSDACCIGTTDMELLQ
jgi:hypothetical protein